MDTDGPMCTEIYVHTFQTGRGWC